MARVPNSSIIAVAVALLVAAFLFGWGAQVETETGPSITVDPESLTPESGIILNRLETGGFSFLGVEFGRKTYWVEVRLAAPPACVSVVESGDPWPAPFTECQPALDIVGEVTGLGIAQTGESLILVRSEVDEGCYEAIQPGDRWPATACE